MNCNTRWQAVTTKQRGLSMVEIMIAIAISLTLLAGVGKIFVSSKLTYRVQDALSRVQETGRFATEFLTKDIRMAGYTGCNNLAAPVNMADLDGDGIADPFTEFSTEALRGYEYGDLPATLTSSVSLGSSDVKANTDVIVLMGAATANNIQLVGNLTTVNANIQLSSASAAGLFQADDILFISDCTDADIFAANNVSEGGTVTIAHSSSVNIGNFLSKTYGQDAMVMKMDKIAYYVATNDNGNPALFRKRLGNASSMITEELVEGVEDLQFQYGEDTDTDGIANRYVDADDVTNMSNVVSVRFGLLIRTDDKIATKAQPYTFKGTTTTPTDRRLRRAFYTVVKLRNRGII